MKKLSTDTNQQRVRLHDALTKHPVTTLQARVELDIFHPVARIQELREQGLNIHTHRRTVATDKGKHAQVAEYVLLPGVV